MLASHKKIMGPTFVAPHQNYPIKDSPSAMNNYHMNKDMGQYGVGGYGGGKFILVSMYMIALAKTTQVCIRTWVFRHILLAVLLWCITGGAYNTVIKGGTAQSAHHDPTGGRDGGKSKLGNGGFVLDGYEGIGGLTGGTGPSWSPNIVTNTGSQQPGYGFPGKQTHQSSNNASFGHYGGAGPQQQQQRAGGGNQVINGPVQRATNKGI